MKSGVEYCASQEYFQAISNFFGVGVDGDRRVLMLSEIAGVALQRDPGASPCPLIDSR